MLRFDGKPKGSEWRRVGKGKECRWCGCKCVECVSKFTCNESNPNCAGRNWIYATGDKLCDTRSATLLPHSPIHFPCHILAVIDANQTWAHHRHYHRHQRQMRFKFDYSQLFRNMHFIFIFNFVFIPILFSRFDVLGMLHFSFCLSFSSHATPHPLWLCDFSCSVSVSVWFRFFPSLLVFFVFFFYFLLVHSSGFIADCAALSPRDGCICLIEIDFSFLAGDLRLDLRTIITITILYGIALYCAVF